MRRENMKKYQLLGIIISALFIMIFQVQALEAKSQVQYSYGKNGKIYYPKTLTCSYDGPESDIEIYFSYKYKDLKITDVKISGKGTYAKVSYEEKSLLKNSDYYLPQVSKEADKDGRYFGKFLTISTYLPKKGTYKVSYTVRDKKNKKLGTYQTTIKANNKYKNTQSYPEGVKSIRLAGKELKNYGVFKKAKKGKLVIKAKKGYELTRIKVSNKKYDFNHYDVNIFKYPTVKNKSIVQTVNKSSFHKVCGDFEITQDPLFVGTEILVRYRENEMKKTDGYNQSYIIYVLNPEVN